MKERVLFEGELGDQSIELVLPELIAKAREMRDEVFLRWNGATIRINGCDSVESLIREYEQQIHCFSLGAMEQAGDLITMRQVENKLKDVVRFLFKDGGLAHERR